MGSIIEDGVYMGVRSLLTNTRRIAWGRSYKAQIAAPHIKLGARIASGAIIMPGVTIGTNSLVGAGSLVDKDVPDLQIWFGSPAKKRGTIQADEVFKYPQR